MSSEGGRDWNGSRQVQSPAFRPNDSFESALFTHSPIPIHDLVS